MQELMTFICIHTDGSPLLLGVTSATTNHDTMMLRRAREDRSPNMTRLTRALCSEPRGRQRYSPHCEAPRTCTVMCNLQHRAMMMLPRLSFGNAFTERSAKHYYYTLSFAKSPPVGTIVCYAVAQQAMSVASDSEDTAYAPQLHLRPVVSV